MMENVAENADRGVAPAQAEPHRFRHLPPSLRENARTQRQRCQVPSLLAALDEDPDTAFVVDVWSEIWYADSGGPLKSPELAKVIVDILTLHASSQRGLAQRLAYRIRKACNCKTNRFASIDSSLTGHIRYLMAEAVDHEDDKQLALALGAEALVARAFGNCPRRAVAPRKTWKKLCLSVASEVVRANRRKQALRLSKLVLTVVADEASDILCGFVHYRSDRKSVAIATWSIIAFANAAQFGAAFACGQSSRTKVLALLGFKPAVDAWDVYQGRQASAGIPPKIVLAVSQAVELLLEAFPQASLQLLVLLALPPEEREAAQYVTAGMSFITVVLGTVSIDKAHDIIPIPRCDFIVLCLVSPLNISTYEDELVED